MKFIRLMSLACLSLGYATAAVQAADGSPDASRAPLIVEQIAGYGVEEAACKAVGYDCERIVADSWCAAHGMDHSVSVRHPAPGEAGDRRNAGRMAIVCE